MKILSRLNSNKKYVLSAKDDDNEQVRLFNLVEKKQKEFEKSKKDNLETAWKEVNEVLKKITEFEKTKKATESELDELQDKLSKAYKYINNHNVQIQQLNFTLEMLKNWCEERTKSLDDFAENRLQEIRNNIEFLRKQGK